MQWKCLPVPRTADGKPGIHYTTIYRVFAKWSDDGSLGQAFIASVRHLAAHGHLDLNVLHGDGTNTVAKKGGDGIGSRVRGLREIWVSGGEAEGLHFVGVVSFGDEFREDGALGVFKRNSGRLWRSAVATTSSEGGMPGRMVRSQEPKEFQTSRG